MDGSRWEDVADDLLFLLAERLVGVTSFFRFSAVCKPWHSIASATKCNKLVPWLMLTEKEGSVLRDFYDHHTKEVYQLSLPQAQGMKNLGFAEGCLITADEDVNIYMINPLSGAEIALPPPPIEPDSRPNFPDSGFWTPPKIFDYHNMKAFCCKIGSAGDDIVTLTHKGSVFGFLSSCHPRGKNWINFMLWRTVAFAFLCDDAYVLTTFSEIWATSNQGFTKIACFPRDVIYSSECNTCYIVECAGEILIVGKIYSEIDCVLKNFRVFKLDVEGKKVVELKLIGNYALLLGTGNSFCLPTSLYGNFFKKNCVYFSEIEMVDEAGKFEVGDEMSVFNLEDGSLTTLFVGLSTAKSSYSFPIWVTLDPQ